MAKVMKEALHSQFPEAAEKDVLKVNLFTNAVEMQVW